MKAQADNSFDIIYADPMFSEIIKESENLEAIKPLANGSRLTEEWLKEAKRVAREKIIIKAHFRDTVFEELGFVTIDNGVMKVNKDAAKRDIAESQIYQNLKQTVKDQEMMA